MSVFPFDLSVTYRAAQVGETWAVFADRWWINNQGDKDFDCDVLAEHLTQSMAETSVETLRMAREAYLRIRRGEKPCTAHTSALTPI